MTYVRRKQLLQIAPLKDQAYQTIHVKSKWIDYKIHVEHGFLR